MIFRQVRNVDQIVLSEGTAPLFLDYPGDPPVLIELATSPPTSLECKLRTQVDPPASVAAAFERLAEGRLPDGHPELTPRDLDRFASADGTLHENHVPPLHLMPQAVRDFDKKLSHAWTAAASSAIGLLRWRSRAFGTPNPFSVRPAEWSLDGSSWKIMPFTGGVEVVDTPALEVSDVTRAELQELLTRGQREPLAHALLREAWTQRSTSPQSAFLIGMTALEVGTKQHISACVPDAAWLVENVPSPPLLKLLTDYLPTLPPPEGGKALDPFPDDLLKVLKKAVTKRNELAHAGASVGRKQLRQTLRAVRNVLWTLDEACGFAWASDYVTPLDQDPPAGHRHI